MSLQLWLPLNGNYANKGLSSQTVIRNQGTTVAQYGKCGPCTQIASGQYITLENAPLTNSTTEFSIAFFMKTGTGTQCLWNGRTVAGSGVALFTLGGKLRFDAGGIQTTFDYSYPTNNTWIHVCVTKDTSVKRLYINGELLEEVADPGSTSSVSTNATIGVSSTGTITGSLTINQFKGSLNDYRVYDHALSVKEVKEISKGLICHLKLDKAIPSSSKVPDVSGFGNNGTSGSSALTTLIDSPRYGKAPSFTGDNNSYINLGRTAMCGDEITVSVWAQSSDWGTWNRRFLSCTEWGGWNFEPGNAGLLNFSIGTGTTSNSYVASPTTGTLKSSLSAGWHHFVGKYDGFKKYLYIDGVKDYEVSTGKSTKTPIFYNANTNIYVGAEAGGNLSAGGSGHIGGLNDVRIYGTALSDSDILELYKGFPKLYRSGTFYASTFSEVDTGDKVKKNGDIESSSFIALGGMNDLSVMSYDGAYWLKVLRHSNPSDLTARFSTSNYGNLITNPALYSRLSDIPKCRSKEGKFEFLVRQKPKETDSTAILRWTQTNDPTTTTTPSDFVNIENCNSATQGIRKNGSSAYLTAYNPNATTNWFGACGAVSSHQGGIPGFNTAVITTGFLELWVRIDNTNLDLTDLTTTATTDAGRIYKDNRGMQFSDIYEI